MKTFELLSYSRKKVKSRRREVFLICTPPIFAGLFLRIAEISLYSFLLYMGAFTPAGLFTGESVEQVIIAVVFAFIRQVISAPLYCASAVRLIEFANDSVKKSLFSEMLLSGRFIWRSISSFFMRKIISAVVLSPAVISGIYAIKILSSDADNTELFIASNLFALCVFSFIAWIAVKISMSAVPFLLAEYPEKSGFRVVFMSFGFMKGRKIMFAGVGILFFLPVITIIAIPFLIPEIASVYAVGMSIFFKEDEYARSTKAVCRKKRFFIRQRG